MRDTVLNMCRSQRSLKLIVTCLLAACGADPVVVDRTAAEAPAGYPLELVSESGRIATIPGPARRIFPGNAGALDLVLSVADPGWVVAVNTGTRPYSIALADGAELAAAVEIPHFDLEGVVAAGPDLIVTHAWQTLDKGPLLERLDYPVFEVSSGSDFDALLRDIESLGQAMDRRERAAEIVRDLRARVEQLGETDRSNYSVMTLSGDGNGLWTAGRETTAAELVRLAGARHLPSERGLEGHMPIDHEKLLDYDPQVLLMPSTDGTLEGSVTWQAIVSDSRLNGLRVRRGEGLPIAVHSLYLSSPTQNLLRGAEALAAALDADQKAEK